MIITGEGRKSSAQAKRDGDWDAIMGEIECLSSLDELHEYKQTLPTRLQFTPHGWIDPVYNACMHREIELRNLEMDAVVGQIMRGEQ
jgi:hypothetical protein